MGTVFIQHHINAIDVDATLYKRYVPARHGMIADCVVENLLAGSKATSLLDLIGRFACCLFYAKQYNGNVSESNVHILSNRAQLFKASLA